MHFQQVQEIAKRSQAPITCSKRTRVSRAEIHRRCRYNSPKEKKKKKPPPSATAHSTVPRANLHMAKRSWQQNLAGCGRCTGIAASFITGCLMGWSISTQNSADSTRAQMLASTFATVAGGCSVSNATYLAFSKHCGCNGNSYNCYDRHQYTVVVLSTSAASISDSIDLERDIGKCEASSKAALASPLGAAARSGATVPCWQPDDPSKIIRQDMTIPTATSLLEGYRCGSYECVKLVDPASEVPPTPEGSTYYIVLFAVSLTYLVVACVLGERLEQPDPALDDFRH